MTFVARAWSQIALELVLTQFWPSHDNLTFEDSTFVNYSSLCLRNGPNLKFGFQNSEAIWAVENYAESNVGCLSLYVHLAGVWRIQRRRHDNDMVVPDVIDVQLDRDGEAELEDAVMSIV